MLMGAVAGLEYDIQRPFFHTSPYSSQNLTLAQEHWDAINFDAGMVYLSDEMAHSLNLPPSQPFPWDESKSIYLLNGYHNLHCLVCQFVALADAALLMAIIKQSIEFSLMDYHHGRDPSYPLQHIMHCLDALRDDVICHADETPRYTTPTADPVSGIGQLRQCRDWNKLEAWAKKHSGCWRYVDVTWDNGSELMRWMHCPPESPAFVRMHTYIASHELNVNG